MTNPTASCLAKTTTSHVVGWPSLSCSSSLPVTPPSSSSSGIDPQSQVEMLETRVQSLKEELAGAHQLIGQQLHELQFLRQALQQVGVETVRVVLRAQAFHPQQDHLLPTVLLDEELSASLNDDYTHSQCSTTSQPSFQDPPAAPPPPLDAQETKKTIRAISSLSSDFSCGSLHPVRVPFRCRRGEVESSSRGGGRRRSRPGLSESVLVTNHLLLSTSTNTAPPHSNNHTLAVDQCSNVDNDGGRFFASTTTNKSVPERSTTEGMVQGRMNANNEDSNNNNNLVVGPTGSSVAASDEVLCPHVPVPIVPEIPCEENSSIDDQRETLEIESCDLQDQEIPRRPLSHTESQATTKVSNTSGPSSPPAASSSTTTSTAAFLPNKAEDILQRRKKFLAKASPTLVASPKDDCAGTQTPLGLKPPERVVSPIPKSGRSEIRQKSLSSSTPPPDLTVNVEGQPLTDAWGQEGVFTGSVDPKTCLPHGHGTIVYTIVAPTNLSTPTPSHTYSGDWNQGKYHGMGNLQEAGHSYQGPFANGVKHGMEEATMTFANGRCFIGRFHKDAMREGVLQYEDGSYYEGLLNNNKRNGFGFYRFSSGDQYEGLWKDDIM